MSANNKFNSKGKQPFMDRFNIPVLDGSKQNTESDIASLIDENELVIESMMSKYPDAVDRDNETRKAFKFMRNRILRLKNRLKSKQEDAGYISDLYEGCTPEQIKWMKNAQSQKGWETPKKNGTLITGYVNNDYTLCIDSGGI